MSTDAVSRGAMTVLDPSRSGHYETRWRDPFDEAVEPFLAPNLRVLDIGSGRQPTLEDRRRPSGCHYVGLDISEHELRLADDRAYDAVVVADVAHAVPDLVGQFDLVVSWQVLEHVKPLDQALSNIRAYLRPGGAIVALFSGKFSAFALVNQLIPRRIGLRFLDRLLGRDSRTVFPAYYHRCYASALDEMLTGWSSARIVPLFRGADYFGFSRRLQQLYLRYEDWALRASHSNLATHYLVVAQK